MIHSTQSAQISQKQDECNIYCYHENNVPSRLSPQWLCGNSCTWAHDVRLLNYVINYAHLASVRFEHSMGRGSLIYIYSVRTEGCLVVTYLQWSITTFNQFFQLFFLVCKSQHISDMGNVSFESF